MNTDIRISKTAPTTPRLVEFARLTRRVPGASLPHPGRSFWVLDYHFEDAGEYSLNGRTWLSRKRDTVHLYAPSTPYWERSRLGDLPFVETYFIFDAESQPVMESLVAPGKGFAHFTDRFKVMREVLAMLPTNTSRETMFWQAQGVLLVVAGILCSARQVGPGLYDISRDGGGEESLARRVDSCLLAHYHERVTLADIAQYAGVSRSTLTHDYRAQTGMTPMTRLVHIRLDAARAMILRGERLKVVAMRTGFCDAYHLSKTFKRYMGHSPRAYLSSVRQRQEPSSAALHRHSR